MSAAATTPAPAKRQPQMDGLRALALLFVLIHHFGGYYLNHLNLGPFGVRFFFVVSGFLITRMLFKGRTKLETGQSHWRTELLTFQVRRIIRTLPAYYLCLLVAAALGIPPVRESLVWTLTFLTNFYIASVGYYPATISHFWTLAVQEQFYLFWPPIILFIPRSWIRYTFPALIIASLSFRYYCVVTDTSYLVRWFNLLGNLDTFAAGGILAYLSLKHPGLIVKSGTRLWTGGLALLAAIVALVLRTFPPSNPLSIFGELFESIVMTWLVACSVTGFSGTWGRFLAWRPLTYLGQVSYGVYIYHVLISILLLPVFLHLGYGDQAPLAIVVRFFIQSVLAIAVASFSWHFFEQPLLHAREKFTRKLAH